MTQGLELGISRVSAQWMPQLSTPNQKHPRLKQNQLDSWSVSSPKMNVGSRDQRQTFAMAAVCDSGFDLVDHPSCSPDLAPSDYFPSPNMEKKT